MAQKEEKYTDPELRERLKREIRAGERGGRPGQWSARKAQLLVREYEKAGGGYKGEKDEDQRHLAGWTKEGETSARAGDEARRYLPKKSWEKMSPEEHEETERIKREAAREGEQYAPNTDAAKEARGFPVSGYDGLTVEGAKGELGGLSEEELKEVRGYEKGHKYRKTLVEWLDARISS